MTQKSVKQQFEKATANFSKHFILGFKLVNNGMKMLISDVLSFSIISF